MSAAGSSSTTGASRWSAATAGSGLAVISKAASALAALSADRFVTGVPSVIWLSRRGRAHYTRLQLLRIRSGPGSLQLNDRGRLFGRAAENTVVKWAKN